MMQMLEIFDGKRWSLLVSRESEVKREAKEGGRDRGRWQGQEAEHLPQAKHEQKVRRKAIGKRCG